MINLFLFIANTIGLITMLFVGIYIGGQIKTETFKEYKKKKDKLFKRKNKDAIIISPSNINKKQTFINNIKENENNF